MVSEEKRIEEEARSKIRAIRIAKFPPDVSFMIELIKKTRAIFEQGTMDQRVMLCGMIEELHHEMAGEKSFNRNLRLVKKTGEHGEGVNHHE